MDAIRILLVLGLIILLIAVMCLASKVQKLHRRARHLRHIVQKLEGRNDEEKIFTEDKEMGGG